jgi:iron-siderophore transport system permease protein
VTALVDTPVESPAETAAPTAGSTPRRRSDRSAGVLQRGWTRGGGLAIAVVVLAVLVFLSLAYGARSISLSHVIDALLHYDRANDDHIVVHDLRIPRTLVGLEVGVALGLAGAVMQGVTRNPLADPSLLGIESGASLAVVMAIYWLDFGSLGHFVWFAFLGAAVAGAVVYALGSMGRGGATPVKLAVAGAALASMLTSITSGILLLDIETLEQFRFWMVGSLAGAQAGVAGEMLPFLVVGGLLALGSARSLNALALGDDMARTLGQRVHLARGMGWLALVILVGASVSVAGPIAFVGLTVPHAARALCGPDYRWILPWSAVLAPALLLGADVIGRLVARPGEVQVGIVTALVGAPLFIALVRRRRLAEL